MPPKPTPDNLAPADLSRVMSALGSRRSNAKTAAARANARKPRKAGTWEDVDWSQDPEVIAADKGVTVGRVYQVRRVMAARSTPAPGPIAPGTPPPGGRRASP